MVGGATGTGGQLRLEVHPGPEVGSSDIDNPPADIAALYGTGGRLPMTSMSPPQTPPLYTPRGKNLALLLLAVTQFVVVIDASIVNVALPSLGRRLPFAPPALSWVVNAQTPTLGGLLLVGGRIAH